MLNTAKRKGILLIIVEVFKFLACSCFKEYLKFQIIKIVLTFILISPIFNKKHSDFLKRK